MSKKSKKLPAKLWTSTTGLPRWSQSPIDLSRMHLLHQRYPRLMLQGHMSPAGSVKITNTGSTVKLELQPAAKLYGGPLSTTTTTTTGEYQFYEMQFRWGEIDALGAEHSIDGVWFSMEAQAMHWNTAYESLDKCYDKEDGIAIVSFLMQVIGCPGMVDNPCFARITDNLCQIKVPGKSVELEGDCLQWIADACPTPGYYTYRGSLTVWPYHECVTWIVLPTPIRISAKQVDAFRSLYDSRGERILSSRREQHRIHDRKVYFATA